ncbi:alpha-1,2-mannosidase, putative [Mucilaginibacter mallensis]|uniref:Alpha-1,2-mannosidase, putative n=1 Tax=Mucilaginibacter mallensis TaxID=652787 RepID=A0A1H1PUX1_MUCMA|nr:GH92 family glycosyl hydrolase [Mucilaginibacter mallensis]SDS15052.1 alpha-1,2-mannosidase, putative [Mucilaginibacter mallensis]
MKFSSISKSRLFTLGLLFIGSNLFAQKPDLVQYANTLQGTNSKYEISWGNVNPVTSLPFAMNGWTAQTNKDGEGFKYQYFVHSIRGFQQTHQCSPWVNDYAVFSLMPVTGKLVVNEDARAATFDHKNEIGKPNYYKVKLDNNITTEISPTSRGAHLRFTFPKAGSYIVLDGYTKMSMVKIFPSERKITGYVDNVRWAPKGFKNYFVIVFDKPFEDYGTWENKHDSIFNKKASDEGQGVGAYIKFKDGAVVQAKVASSYISPEQAEVTLQAELGNQKSFDDTKNAAFKVWNNLFNRVLIEGGTEEERSTFYSCLYRANLFSHEFFEYDKTGRSHYYSPYDGQLHDGYMYTDNGFWDTFRAQFPLNCILHPKMQGQYVEALLDAQQQCGWLPAWSFPSETGGMLGNHAISLLTDAWVKGIRTFDPQRALEAYFHEASNKGPWGGANGRPYWKQYWQIGYIPFPQSQGSVGQTLESAYDDFCGYQLAKLTGNSFYEGIFAKQMYNYKNLWDPSTRFMRGRGEDGKFAPDFDPLDWGGPYTEGNAWHWVWSVFHDEQGLINLFGGDKNFTAKLDSVFSEPNTIKVGAYGQVIHEMTEMKLGNMGQYAQGNEPVHHMIYLYDYAGQPWKAQQHIREVMDKLYNSTENGYPGDEDEGQMSSWYVLSAMGVYSVCPGTDQYVIGSPEFNKITITMEDGKKFIIEANNNSKQNMYIQSGTLNGTPFTHNWIKYSDIVNGGTLHFEMGAQPNLQRGLSKEDKPFSLTAAE